VPRPGNYLSHEEDPHGLLVDFRNNVVYGGRGANYDEDSITHYNFVNNYNLTDWRLIEHSPFAKGHFAGNYEAGAEVEDQWGLLSPGSEVQRETHEQAGPFDPGMVTTRSATEAWEWAIAHAGAWKRDAHDEFVIQEVINFHRAEIEGLDAPFVLPDWWREGAIDHQDEVGGLPVLDEVRMPDWIDSSGNGLPDWWELARGLDSADPNLARLDSNGNGYTNIEDYINDLDAIRVTHAKVADGAE